MEYAGFIKIVNQESSATDLEMCRNGQHPFAGLIRVVSETGTMSKLRRITFGKQNNEHNGLKLRTGGRKKYKILHQLCGRMSWKPERDIPAHAGKNNVL